MKIFLGLVVIIQVIAFTRADHLDQIKSLLRNNEEAYIVDLINFISFPSISASPDHLPDIKKASEWLEKYLKTTGNLQNVQILTLDNEAPRPAVYGEYIIDPNLPTALIYGHYDVQPADPVSDWDSAPFNGTITPDGYIVGRGASDDKGGLLMPVQAIGAIVQTNPSMLPLNIKFFFEGEEEILSPYLESYLKKYSDLLSCDFVISADASQLSEKQPILNLGLRGAAIMEVEVATMKGDVHSGMYGGAVQNPARAMAHLLASLHDPQTHKVMVKGFYDTVLPITAEDRNDILTHNFDDTADIIDALGAVDAIGEEGYSTLERIWFRPTLEIIGMHSGYAGAGFKSVLPAKAIAKLGARLVPGQDPQEIIQLIKIHFEEHHPPGCNVTLRDLGFTAHPYVAPRDTSVVVAAARVLKDIMGKDPMFERSGATIPAMALFQQHLGVETTAFGFGLPDDRVHAPNERYKLSQYARGREAYVKVLIELGKEIQGGRLVKRTKGSTRERVVDHSEL